MPPPPRAARGTCASSAPWRGEERPESDVDLLVELEPGRTLFDLAVLEERLEGLLGRPVQVATARALRAPVRRAAEREAVRVA